MRIGTGSHRWVAGRRAGLRTAIAGGVLVLGAGLGPVLATTAGAATPAATATTSSTGYLLDGSDGGVYAFGAATFYGSMGGKPLNAPVVGIAATPSGKGYWLVAADGGVFTYGDATFDGSMGGKPLNAPIVGIAPTANGNGYWLVAADGGVFGFGGATFDGSMGGKPLNAPIVGIAPTASGNGYWLVAADGGVFGFGGATFQGSMGGKPLNAPIAGATADLATGGYWLVGRDGGVFGFNAPYDGRAIGGAVVGITAANGGGGYWTAARTGAVDSFGNATFFGSMGGRALNAPIVGITPVTTSVAKAPVATLTVEDTAGPPAGGNHNAFRVTSGSVTPTMTLTFGGLDVGFAPTATLPTFTTGAFLVYGFTVPAATTVPAYQATPTAPVPVTVVNSGGRSNVITYTYAVTPTLSSISPATANSCRTSNIATLSGTGFNSTMAVWFTLVTGTTSQPPFTVTFTTTGTATQVTFMVASATRTGPNEQYVAAGRYHVTVTTPGGSSNPLTFTYVTAGCEI